MKGGVHGKRGACMAKGGMKGEGRHAWQRGVCMAKGVHMAKGGVCVVCTPDPRDTAGHCAGGTHPTGMHSCLILNMSFQ